MEAARDWSAFDRPEVRAGFGSATAQGCEVLLALDGVHCAACAGRVERLLAGRADQVRVNVAARTVAFRHQPDRVRISELLAALDQAGFAPQVLAREEPAAREARRRRLAFARIGVATICAMQVMMLAWPSYFGVTPEPAIAQLLRWSQLIIAIPGVLWAGWPFFDGAWQGLRGGQLDMNAPVALALGVAFAASLAHTVAGSGDLYFDTATMFVWFLAVGRYLEGRTRARAGEHLRLLAGRRSLTAQRRRDGLVETVGIGQLRAGDTVVVPAGEALPADGLVLEQAAELDESLLTGESHPVLHQPGQNAPAGSINLGSAPLLIEVLRTGADTVLAQITRLLDSAQGRKPRLQQLADRIAGHFVAAVLALAALGYAAALWRGAGAGAALNIALAVLVASCPCALSLAIPAALAAATSKLARHGILVTNAGALRALASIDTVLFDKTGTLTRPGMSLRRVVPLADQDADTCTGLAAALEQGSRHPIASAFAAGASTYQARDLDQIPGAGVGGTIQGMRYWLGAPELAPYPARLPGAESADATCLVLCDDSRALAWFELGAELRPEAGGLMDELRRRGLALQLLSGDAADAVAAVASRLGLSMAKSRQTPEDKLAHLEELQASSHGVLAVGDGINDAPLLAAARVSAAMPQGAALTQSRADLLLLGDSLAALPLALDTARAAQRRIRENLGWALLYNLLALPLAMSGHLPPWLAALGMSLSSLLVIANALRLGPAPSLVASRPSQPDAEPARWPASIC
ncbi:MAG TPA: cation-translocating P-type ATPase [Nevskia sp.]|nr:cation-translocating P-type ATPase [Nevskia sp.]